MHEPSTYYVIDEKINYDIKENKGCYKSDDFIMLLTFDFVFKLLFGDSRYQKRLISLLSAILDLPKENFEGIELINAELKREFKGDKKGMVDIKTKLKDGRQTNIEIQVIPFFLMPERTLFYWSRMYSRQINEGGDCKNLGKCITINMLDYSFLPINKIHTICHYIT